MTSGSLTLLRDVGSINRSRVIQSLSAAGPASRSDLARRAGVTRATIGTIVQGLIDDGLLVELPANASGRSAGKPARPVWFAPGAGSVAAVELGAAEVRCARVDATGARDGEVVVPLARPDDLDTLTEAIVRAVRALPDDRPLVGIGIAIPGAVDPERGEVLGSSRLPGAVGTTLGSTLAQRLELPVHLDHDARAQALAEQWFGRGRGEATFASVQTGEGLSVGLVLDGSVYRGPHLIAGELGHTAVQLDGATCRCGLRGCWETVANIHWLREEASRLGLSGAAAMDCGLANALADRGDTDAETLVERYADRLAIGLANLHQILGITLFVLHGDAVAGGERFRERVQRAADARSLRPVRVESSELGDAATVLGAAAVVLAEELHRS